jgi:hypothetical protein
LSEHIELFAHCTRYIHANRQTSDQLQNDGITPPLLLCTNQSAAQEKVNNGREGGKISSDDFIFTDNYLLKPACLLNFTTPPKYVFSISKTSTGSALAAVSSRQFNGNQHHKPCFNNNLNYNKKWG